METKLNRDTLIIGGTGTLGRALLEKLDNRKCVVFSRDELKQHELRHQYPGLKTIIGDIRNERSVRNAMEGMEQVFLVAALKHVDVLEESVEEAYQTNVEGVVNCAEVAKLYAVKDFYFSSTDKAVLPINVYGMTKAISERYLLNQNSDKPFTTNFKVFRWGNIIGSRGSVVGLFVNSLLREGKVRITDKRMTRFWLRIEDAVNFMLNCDGDFSKVRFPDLKAAPVLSLAKAIADVLNVSDYQIEYIPIRPGEKLHECMFSSHDECLRSDTAPQYTHDELVDLVKPVIGKL